MRRVLAVILAVFFGLLGPKLTGPRSRAAGEPFAYEPPEGFVEVQEKSAEVKEKGGADGHFWIESGKSGSAAPRVVVHHSSQEMLVEEQELAKLAAGMPKVFDESECTWVLRRHEMRRRPDGGRVGLIEGDCNRDVDLAALGLPTTKLRLRKLQLMFPDDTGTSIATASYPTEDAAKWEPLFEATISRAHGVAVRVPPTAPWIHAAWAGAGAVLGWLAGSLSSSAKRSEPSKKETPKKATPKRESAKKDGEDDEDDEDDEEEDGKA